MNIQKLITLTLISLFIWQMNFSQPVLTANVGHSGKVSDIAYSSDGKYIVSSSWDKTLILWDRQSGREIRNFKGHDHFVECVAISPDNKYIVSGSMDRKLKLWDSQTGQEIRELLIEGYSPHSDIVNCVLFSPDGKYIVSCSDDSKLKLWKTQTGEWIRTFKGHTSAVNSVSFSPDGKYIVSGSDDCTLKLWDIQSGKTIRSFQTHKPKLKKGQENIGVNREGVNSVAFSPDGKFIVSGSKDKIIRLYNVGESKSIRIFQGHSSDINSVAFSPNGKYIVSGSGALTSIQIKLWDIQTGQLIKNFEPYLGKGLNSLAFSPDCKYIVSGSDNKIIEEWDIQTGKVVRVIKGYTSWIRDLALNPSGEYIVLGNNEKTVELFGFKTKKVLRNTNGHENFVNSVAFSPDGKNIVSGGGFVSFNNEINLWDLQTGFKLRTFKGHTKEVKSVNFSPDGKHFVSGSMDKTIKLWNIQNGQLIKTMTGHSGDVNCTVFSPDGKYIISAGDDKKLKLWNAQTGQEIKTFQEHIQAINSVAFSPDGNSIVSGGGYANFSNEIILFDTHTGQKIRSFEGHTKEVESVVISPNGKYIASGSLDCTIKLWDIQSGKEIREFKGHSINISKVLFSPNSKYIISGSYDGSIKIWETETGKLLATLYALVDSDDWIAVSPDGRFDGSEKGMELLYYVDGMEIIPLSSLFEQYYTPNLLARVMAGEQFEETEVKINDIKLPPHVVITSPENNNKSNSKEVTISIKVTDQGGGIDEIRLYHNGKLVETTQRGFKPVENKDDARTKTFTINLTEGENTIKATAFNNQRTEAIPDEITVFYEGAKASSDLHMLVIGIDNYKNPRLKLNYALADANAFKQEVEKGCDDIFGTVNITFIKDADATRNRIMQEFNTLASKAKQEDVFIFYYAGHGAMSEEQKARFHIIPYDVTQLYGNNEMLKTKAISAEELQIFSTRLKAQKQMFVLDACQSGGMTELLASRGAAEQKAIAQLARSTGTFWLTASNSEQFATEFSELGHGVFTYAVLLALQGQADGGSKDKKITVKEISAFLNDMVPELSEKHKGEAQYPTSYGYGQDFPVVIIK